MKSGTLIGLSIVVLGVMVAALVGLRASTQPDRTAERLVFYCAAGIQGPVQQVIEDYRAYYRENFGREVSIEVEYGGSGTLLSALQVANRGDLYLAADDSYIQRGREAGVVAESIPLATMRPVIAVSEAKKDEVASLEDLVDGDLRIAIGVPEGPAIGTVTKQALEAIGRWEGFERNRVTVTKPTVNDLANDVKIGTVDATIVWDVIARQYELPYVRDPILDEQVMEVTVGILTSSDQPTAALHFARFLGAPERGLTHFEASGFDVVQGDRWVDQPEVNFFSGGLNRRAMEPVLEAFQKREGVRINTVYSGCGALNAQMATIREQNPDMGFPDAYLACDVYYLDPVGDWFEDAATVSSTRIVIVTQKDNRYNIQSLEDLTQPGIRIVVGHPTHCTIGGLTERLFKAHGLYDEIMENVVEEQPSSGMMVPPVVSGAADASLAYYNDTLPEKDKLHVVEIDSEYANAVQPFGIASTSKHKQLMHRLYQFIGQSEEIYAELGFGWELGRSPDEFELVAPAGARPPRPESGRPN